MTNSMKYIATKSLNEEMLEEDGGNDEDDQEEKGREVSGQNLTSLRQNQNSQKD